jgi:tetratricopeptide (TPR) repeat protein
LLDELDPDSWQARQILDRIEDALLQASQQNELLTLLNRRLERIGHQPDLLQRIIRLLRIQNRSTDAMQLLEQQLKTAPENRDLRLLLVSEYTRAGRVADAIAQYQALDQAGLLRSDDREAWGQLLLADRAASESPPNLLAEPPRSGKPGSQNSRPSANFVGSLSSCAGLVSFQTPCRCCSRRSAAIPAIPTLVNNSAAACTAWDAARKR